MRPVVKTFADDMEYTLQANDHKGGWENDTLAWLVFKLIEEVGELGVEMQDYNRPDFLPADNWEVNKRIRAESVDVANLAMMIADRAYYNIGSNRGEVS